MIKNLFIYLIIFFIASFSAFAQTINLEFPYFAGKTYEFKIVQGDKQIVLQRDTIPKGGKVKLQIPREYKGYKGMAMWYLTNTEQGGGLEMVINNEDFSVTCLDPIPTNENIIYKNSRENSFANANFQKQQDIFAKHDAMLYAVRAYHKTHALYSVFYKEYDVILQAYDQFVKKLKDTPLYAARFREIANLTMGIGSIITQDETLKAQNINDIIVNQLDYEVLYTSNHWGGIINNWVQLQTAVINNDQKLIADAKTILKRLPSNLIYTEFVISLTKELTIAGKDAVITALTQEIKTSNRLLNYEGALSIYQKDLTGKAPNLVVVENTNGKIQSKTINLEKLKNKYTLLVFHVSGCGPCEDLMIGLQDNYKKITANGLEIISISADTDQDVFQNSTASYPWSKKYCDLKGINGINFDNYAILGTPTLYLLDNQGMIIRKMSSLLELLLWSKS